MRGGVQYDQTQRARALRNNPKHEQKLWGILSRLRPKFTRQPPIGPYFADFADFACRKAELIVELDGGQHAESECDQRRDEFLRREGWIVLRLWNDDFDYSPEGVFQAIVNRAAEVPRPHPPQPLPSREGRKRRSRD